MGTHLRVLSESYPMNTNMGLHGFQKSLHPCPLDESNLSIGRINPSHAGVTFLWALSDGLLTFVY